MAKVKVEMPEEFLRKLSLLGSKTDEIAGRVLEAGGEVVLSKVRSNLSSVIGSGTKYGSRSTGELERSLGLTPPLVDRDEVCAGLRKGFAGWPLLPYSMMLASMALLPPSERGSAKPTLML